MVAAISIGMPSQGIAWPGSSARVTATSFFVRLVTLAPNFRVANCKAALKFDPLQHQESMGYMVGRRRKWVKLRCLLTIHCSLCKIEKYTTVRMERINTSGKRIIIKGIPA